MSRTTTIVNPLEYARWDDQVLALPGATIFHSSAWTRVLVDAFSYTPLYFCHTEGNRMTACFPVMQLDSFPTGRKGKTLPFTDLCNPLIHEAVEARAMLKDILEYGRRVKWKTFELRGGAALLPGIPCHTTCYGHTIDLAQGAEQALGSFRDSTRRNIKRANVEGIQVEHHTSFSAVCTYYHLHTMTRKRQGLFCHPFVLFQKIHEHIIGKGLGFVSLAMHNHQVVAGAIYFHTNHYAVFAYGASDMNFQHLRMNNAVMWDAVRWYAGQGYDILDLGTTDATNPGLRQYKSGMATRENELHYYKYDFRHEQFMQENSSVLSSLRIGVCKRAPAPLLKGVGTLLYKYHG